MDKRTITTELMGCLQVIAQNADWSLTIVPSAEALRDVAYRLSKVADAAQKMEADVKLAEARALVAKADSEAADKAEVAATGSVEVPP